MVLVSHLAKSAKAYITEVGYVCLCEAAAVSAGNRTWARSPAEIIAPASASAASRA